MQINHRIEHVTGAFETDTGKLVCVQKKKYGEILLCFAADWNIPFAEIRLHTRDRAIDSDAVFEDAVNLGKEIVRRWNEYTHPFPIHHQTRSNLQFDVTTSPESRSTCVIGALTIKYGACMSEAEASDSIVEGLKKILTERFDVGLHGFDQALAKHDLGSDGQRIRIAPEFKDGQLAAIEYIDNWDGQEDHSHTLAQWRDGEWWPHEGGDRLLSYEGSRILNIWPLTQETAYQP